MNKLFYSILLLITLLIFSCRNREIINDVNTKFYSELEKQINSEYFSPLKFAGQKKAETLPVSWDLSNDTLIISAVEGKTIVNLSPISISFESHEKSLSSTYEIVVYSSNGSSHVISSLKNPRKKGSSLQFSTSDKNMVIELEPNHDYIRWKIQSIDHQLVDSIAIKSKSKGPFYGGGERYIGSKLNGRTISNQPNDHYWDPPQTETSPWGNPHEPGHYKKYEPTYLQIAYFMSPHGQAWFIDDAASIFMTFSEKGNEFDVRIESSQTEFYTIQRISAKQALTTYTALVGRQPEIADWALGVWVNLLDGQDSVYAKANRLKDWEIPATAIWVFDMGDIPNSQGYQNWTTGPYPNLREMTDSLHELGFKVLSYLHPYQEETLPKSDRDNPTYLKLDSLGVLLLTPQEIRNNRYGYDTSGLYNFHLPLMGEMWQQMLHNVLIRDNFDGYMEDFGDLSYCFDREEIQWKAIDYGQETPLTPNQYNNSYPLIYHKLSYLQALEIKEDIATFCRSGSLGSAAYTKIVWGGDQMSNWDKTFGYPTAVVSGISCGLSGYASWTPDILSSSPDMELWKRWVQFAAFTPIMRDHLWVNEATSVDIWFNEETPQYFKHYAKIHMDLVPYIQESLAVYRETGIPVVRHMMLDFAEDEETYNCEYQYMFGPKYLVAPIVDKGHSSKDIYFPKGSWKSYWGEEIVESAGEWITVSAPLDIIPVYERL